MNEMPKRSQSHDSIPRPLVAGKITIPSSHLVRRRPENLLLVILISLTLTSCADRTDSSPTVVATDQPQSTDIAPAEENPLDGILPPPLTEATPAIIIEPSFPAPTPTNLPPSVNVPLEELSILSPGPGSMGKTPIQVNGYGGPSMNNRLEVRLIGEDGRLLSKGYTFLYSYPGTPGLFYIKTPFESPLVAERAWLEVRSFDDLFGILRHLTTVEISILTTGSDQVYPAIHGAEKLTIFRPRENAVISDGRLLVEGAGWVDKDVPLHIEIINLAGDIVGSGQVEIDAPAVGQLGTFSVEIPYQIPYQQWVRIGVYENHNEVPGLVHYTSVGVWLGP